MSSAQSKIPKVGRQRIFSTEQRKDRNRKAQADFRNRRNNYTKGLEAALLELENKVKHLQEANKKLEQRAKAAEDRCDKVSLELSSMQNILETAILNNQHQLSNYMEFQNFYDGSALNYSSVSLNDSMYACSESSSGSIIAEPVAFQDFTPSISATNSEFLQHNIIGEHFQNYKL